MKIRYAVPALVAAAALALTGCTNDDTAVFRSVFAIALIAVIAALTLRDSV